MHGSCTFISSRYYTPSITLSTDLSTFEGKICVPYFRDKFRAFQRRHTAKKYSKEEPAYNFTPPALERSHNRRKSQVLDLLLPAIHKKQVNKRQHNTDQLIKLLSCYPIASSIASYLNKAELEALFSPKCSRQIYYKLRHKPNVSRPGIPRSPSTTSIFQRTRGIGVLYDNKSIAYKTTRNKEAAESQTYYMNLLDLTRECEKCGDTSHRYVPMLLDMGLTYQLFSVLQGITPCYICKKLYCHVSLPPFSFLFAFLPFRSSSSVSVFPIGRNQSRFLFVLLKATHIILSLPF